MTASQIVDIIWIVICIGYLLILLWLWWEFKNAPEVPKDEDDF